MTSDDIDTEGPTVGAAIDDWLIGRIARHEIEDTTADSYRSHVRQFIDHVGADRPLSAIDKRTVESWLAAARIPSGRPPLQPSSLNTKAATLRSFFRAAHLDGLIDRDPMVRIKRAKTARRPPRDIPPDDVSKILDVADFRARTMIIVAVQMGLRREEITKMQVDDWDRETGYLYIRGKGAREANLPVTAETSEALNAWLADGRTNGPMWPSSHRPGQGLSKRRVSEIITEAAAQAGLKYTPHQYRHTFANEMIAYGATLPAVRDAMRHSSLGPTNAYLHTRPEALRDEMEGRKYYERKAS